MLELLKIVKCKLLEIQQFINQAPELDAPALRCTLDAVMDLNSDLCTLLDQPRQEAVNVAWSNKVLETDNFETLQSLQGTGSAKRRYRKVNILAAMKYMCLRSSQGARLTGEHGEGPYPHQGLQIQQSELSIENPPLQTAEATIGRFRGHYVLIEWKYYDNRWAGEIGNEMYDRLQNLSYLLSYSNKARPDALTALYCEGFFHDEARNARNELLCRFGFLYRFPKEPAIVISLFQYIQLTNTNKSLQRPFLGDLFILGHKLAKSLSCFHMISWLHKSLSSRNVMVFPISVQETHSSIPSPYICGFDNSRPEDYDKYGYTEGPVYDDDWYMHPKYRADRTHFKRAYDIYSFGIVLLEVGMWNTLSAVWSSKMRKGITRQQFLEMLPQVYVPRLGETMGIIYENVVRECLQDNFGSAYDSVEVAFQELVVGKLAGCRA